MDFERSQFGKMQLWIVEHVRFSSQKGTCSIESSLYTKKVIDIMLLDLKNLLAKYEIIKGSPYFKLDENLITDYLVIDQM